MFFYSCYTPFFKNQSMKNILLFSLLSSFVYSQNVTVRFKFHLNHEHDLFSTIKKFTLKQNDNFSIFEIDNIKDIKQLKFNENASVYIDRDTLVNFKINDNTFWSIYEEKLYKDYKKNYQIYNFYRGSKFIYIEDKIDIFNWVLQEKSDTLIANYKCKKAITKFRGRDYVAYYTNEIANQGGPWKFDGLPGFILKIYSKDKYILIEPTEVILNEINPKEIVNPYATKKTITFEKLPEKIIELEKLNFIKEKLKTKNNLLRTTVGKINLIEDIGLNTTRIYE